MEALREKGIVTWLYSINTFSFSLSFLAYNHSYYYVELFSFFLSAHIVFLPNYIRVNQPSLTAEPLVF